MRNLFYNNTQQKKLFFNNLPIQRAYLDNVFCFEAVIRVPYPVLASNPTQTGKAVSPTFNNINNDAFTVSGNSYVNAGSYKAVFKLKDGYGWNIDNESKMYSDYEIPQSINRAKLNKPTITSTTLTYKGSAFNVTSVLSGYNSSYMVLSGTTSATNVGTYTVYITPDSNHCWQDGSTGRISLTWKINKKSLAKPYLSGPSKSFAFDGNNRTWTVINYNSSYMNQSGSTSFNASSYTGGNKTETVRWTLKDTTNYQWSDGSTGAVTDSWSVSWVNGQSHYGKDLYNHGWTIGSISVSNWSDNSHVEVNGDNLFLYSCDYGYSGNRKASVTMYAPGLPKANHIYMECQFDYDVGYCSYDTGKALRGTKLTYNASNGWICDMAIDKQQPWQSPWKNLERKQNVDQSTSSSDNTLVLTFQTYGPSNCGWQGQMRVYRIWYD